MPELEQQTGELEVTLEDVNQEPSKSTDANPEDNKGTTTEPGKEGEANSKATAQDDKKAEADDSAASKALKDNVAKGEEGKAKEADADTYAELDAISAEGVTVAPETLKSFKEIAKANNLSPEAAKSIVELQVNAAKKQVEDFKALQASWEAQNKSTYGDNLKNVETNCSRVLAELDKDGKFKELLALAGAEKHPATLGFLKNIGELLLEKESVNPNATVSTDDEEVDLENFN